jgi:chromosome segregation ATPase
MLFSPPNQSLNERRAKEMMEAKEKERYVNKNGKRCWYRRIGLLTRSVFYRMVRIARARADMLQVHSPTQRDEIFRMPSEEKVEGGEEVAPSIRQTKSEESVLTSDSASYARTQDNEMVTSELRILNETVAKLLDSKEKDAKLAALTSDQLSAQNQLATERLRNESLQSTKDQMEERNANLQTKIRQNQEKWVTEKESLFTEKLRLESRLEALRNELEWKVKSLDEAKSMLHSQLHDVTKEKNTYIEQKQALEEQIEKLKENLLETKEILATQNAEKEMMKQSMGLKQDSAAQENSQLKLESMALETTNKKLEKRIEEYLKTIENLETHVLPEKDRGFAEAQAMIERQGEQISGLALAVEESNIELQRLTKEIESVGVQREEERLDFQKNNEDSEAALDRIRKDADEKDGKIQDLIKELGEARLVLDEQYKSSLQMKDTLESEKADMESRVRDLEVALEESMAQLDQGDEKQVALNASVQQLKDQLAAEISVKEEIQQEKLSTKESLVTANGQEKRLMKENERHADNNRHLEQRVSELEHTLKATISERNDLRQHVDGQGSREEVLYQRLQASDAVRRELHARVMQLMGNIRVFVRVRPLLATEAASQNSKAKTEASIHFPGHSVKSTGAKTTSAGGADDLTKKIVEVTEPWKDRGGLSERRKKWRFGFDEVFNPEQSQNEVWEATEPLVQSAIDGFNVTVFAYGQTGSGKTYTLLGDGHSSRGVIGNSIQKLFHTKQEMATMSEESSMTMSVELLEVYNEEIRDLLVTGSGPNGKVVPLKVNSQEVVGNLELPVATEAEVSAILETAQKRRCVKATASNAESSRSHLLFTLNITVELEGGMKRIGKLNICDLAGSERLSKSGTHLVGVRTQTRYIPCAWM